MKKLLLFPFVVGLLFGLGGPRFAYADDGGGTESSNNGLKDCGAEPSGGPPQSEINACSKSGNACPPLNPPPTTWHRYCCYNNVNNQACIRSYRWQCCSNGTNASWQLAYKLEILLDSCAYETGPWNPL